MTALAVTSIAGTRGMDHGEQLSRIARKYPARTAYICDGESRTFGEVDRRVTSLAHALMARGLRHGDRLALLMKNSIEMTRLINEALSQGVLPSAHAAGEGETPPTTDAAEGSVGDDAEDL